MSNGISTGTQVWHRYSGDGVVIAIEGETAVVSVPVTEWRFNLFGGGDVYTGERRTVRLPVAELVDAVAMRRAITAARLRNDLAWAERNGDTAEAERLRAWIDAHGL